MQPSLKTSPPASTRPVRPVLVQKKSVTFHPSTKAAAASPIERPVDITPIGALLHYAELSPHRHDNAFIHTGYRPQTSSHLAALGTVFGVHNETCNIWTHLFPLLLLIPGSWWFLTKAMPDWYPSHTPGDRWAFVCFFLGAGTCWTASALWHAFTCLGPRAARFWNGVDYAGISACIWGSFMASMHFGLPDEGAGWDGIDHGLERRRRYESMITGLAAVCVTISILPAFRTPTWRPFRAAMFVAMGGSAVVPVVHQLAVVGWRQVNRQMGLSWVVLQGVLYVVGAALYAARFPEKWYPGQFDIFGASHQIFHSLTVLAAASQLTGLLKALDYACRTR